MKNSVQRKTNSSSTLTKANILAHAPQTNTRPVSFSQMSSVFTSVPPLFGTAQAFLLRLAQLEAQLVLNLIGHIAAGNNTVYGNPFIPLLQPVGIQRSSFLSMYQPPGVFTLSHLAHRKNMDFIPHVVSPPSSSITEMKSVLTREESSDLLTKEVIQEKTLTSEEPFVRSTTNHFSKQFTFKPDVEYSQFHSMTSKVMPSERPQTEDVDPKQPAMLNFPTESLIKALASLGLSLEDLELLSHCPDNQLTTEKLPLIIQDIQQRKGTRDTENARWNSSDQVESSRRSSYTPGKLHDQIRIRRSEWQESAIPSPCRPSCRSYFHRSFDLESYSPSELLHDNLPTQSRGLKRIRVPPGEGSNAFVKRLQHGPAEVTRWRPGSVCFPSRSKCSIRHSFVSTHRNKTKYYMTKGSLSPSHRSNTHNTRKGHHHSLIAGKSGATKSKKIQMPVTKMAAKTSTQSKGVIRVSGIHFDYSESDLIKMASPFGHPVDVLMATEVDMVTCLERNKALLMLPNELSAEEMVKVYSAIPVHMRQQCLELVSQTVDLSSPVSVFHAFVGPSISNGLLTPLDRLLVVCNVPDQPCAATGVLRLLKPFGQILQTLVFNGNKVAVGQCLWNKNSIQMVLEMESATVALSVYEWSHKIPCLYHNHHLSFFRGCDVQ